MAWFPTERRKHPRPMKTRPEPPEPGEAIQLGWYRIEARRCSCCSEPRTRYIVRNIPRTGGLDGAGLLSMAFDWDRLLHGMGFYCHPDADELGAKVRSNLPPVEPWWKKNPPRQLRPPEPPPPTDADAPPQLRLGNW